MGLHDLIGAEVRWISRPGMMWGDVFTCISTQLFHTTPPDMLVIHCGGNSIGALPLLDLRLKMFETISELATILPNTLLVCSELKFCHGHVGVICLVLLQQKSPEFVLTMQLVLMF